MKYLNISMKMEGKADMKKKMTNQLINQWRENNGIDKLNNGNIAKQVIYDWAGNELNQNDG